MAGGLVEIENCSFFQNIAEGGTGGQGGNGVGGLGRGGDGGDGGAARGAGLFVALGEVYLNSSTLAHEECLRGLPGGGGLGGGSTNLDGDDGNPGAWLGECLARTGGSLHVSNTLLDGIRRLRNCSGTVSDQGHNLSSDASCGFDDTGFNAIDPLLQSSADITDATEVLELLPGSPAIDAADPTTAAALDQLGTDRVGPPDIGALEFVMALIEVSVTQIATEVVEGKSEEYLEICRTGPLDRIVKVNFTLGGTAVPSTDYALSGTGLSSNAMTFSTGAECSQIDITTHSDGKVAPAKTASLELADGTYHIGFPRTALMLILETNLPLITTTLAQEDRFTFGFHSLTSQLYQVEWSTNLIHWSDLAELQGSPDSNSLTYFTDPDSSLDRPKFYRIRVD